MDWTKYGLEGERLAQAQKDYDADVLGLKNKNTELIERETKSKANYMLELETQAVDFAKKEEATKLEIAEATGSIEKFKAQQIESEEKIKSIKFEFQESTNARVKSDAVNEFSSLLATGDPMGRKGMIDTFKDSFDVVDGKLTPKDATKSLEEITQSLVSDKANARYVVKHVGSGAGSAGSESSGGAASTGGNKSFKDRSMAEKVAYLEQKQN